MFPEFSLCVNGEESKYPFSVNPYKSEYSWIYESGNIYESGKISSSVNVVEWGELKDDLVCSRIVSGISSTTVRERLLRSENDLKLQKAIDICRKAELSKQQMK